MADRMFYHYVGDAGSLQTGVNSVNASGTGASNGGLLQFGLNYCANVGAANNSLTLPAATGSGGQVHLRILGGQANVLVFARGTDGIGNSTGGTATSLLVNPTNIANVNIFYDVASGLWSPGTV